MNGYTGPKTKYIVARANQTAMAFVSKSEREQEGWIVLHRTNDYWQAMERKATANVVIRRCSR